MDNSDNVIQELKQKLHDSEIKFNELKASFENDIKVRKQVEEKLIKRSSLLSAFNQYSIDLAGQETETIQQFIVNSFKVLFEVRAVWISIYDEKNSELILETSTATEEETSRILKLLGLAFKRFKTVIDEEKYRFIIDSGTKLFSSLHSISFGQISKSASKAIERLLNVAWFQGVALIDKGKLLGTLVIAGQKGQEQLPEDIVKIFADITSSTLSRKEAEYKLNASEALFRKAFTTSPDSININRLSDGKYISINNGFTNITGYSTEETIGKTSFEIDIWADSGDREKLVKGLREVGTVLNLEARFRMKDGTLRNGLMSASLIDLDGVTHILSITRDISEKKRIESDLKESETRFRELIELAPDGILIGLHDGTIHGANSRMLTITGRTLAELIGMDIALLFSDQELNSLPLRYDLLEAEESVTSIRTIKRPDGSTVTIEMHTKMMPDGTYQSIWHDITNRKLVEDALLKSKEQYDDLVKKIPVGIYILRTFPDDKFALDYISPRMSEMLDTSIDVLLSDARNIYSRIHPDDKESFIRLNEGGIKSGQPFCWSGRSISKGAIKWLQISSAPEPQENGEVLWHGIVVDITEQKKAEKLLIDSERLLRESQNIARLGSFVWDIPSGLWKSSGILDEIFGIDGNYIRSFDSWVSLVHPEYQKVMSDYVTFHVLGNNQKFDKEYQIIRKSDGQVRWVHGLGELEFEANNQPVRLIGTIIDITERKKVEEEINKLNTSLEERVIERTAQLEAANSELQAFAYSVSHDLRAPLRAIDGFSKFVLEDYGSKLDSEGQRLLGLVRSNTQKMDKLITDILSLSRVSRTEHKKSAIDMTKMALSMYNEAALPEIQQKIELIIDPLPGVFADPTFIKQVWINLLSNAIKFSSLSKNPEIRIGGYNEGKSNVYFVRDNGVGFNPEYSHKLFGVFQRLHKVTEFEGTGVGLAIVQRIILRHGGKVWAESKEGYGATFYFSLPVSEIT
jgi:PAS domain S-box-containing protein